MIGGLIFIVGTISGGAYLTYKINDELYPYTIKDFDYNIKNCLQHIEILDKDASYVKALIKAKERERVRYNSKRLSGAVNDIINSFKDVDSVSRIVYKDSSYRGTVKEKDIEFLSARLEELGFIVVFSREDYSYRDDALGTLKVSVEVK